MVRFKENVLRILESNGFNQTDLANRLGKSQQNVSIILKKNTPSVQTLQEFAKALDVDVSELTKSLTPNEEAVIGRINAVIQYLGLNNKTFSEQLGFDDEQSINEIIQGKALVGTDFLHRFTKSNVSHNINLNWLITGEGEMLKSAALAYQQGLLENTPEWDFNSEETRKALSAAFKRLGSIDPIKRQKDKEPFEIVDKVRYTEFRKLKKERYVVITPLVSSKFQRSYSSRHQDSKFIEALPLHAVTIGINDSEEYRSFEVTIEFSSPNSNYTLQPGMIVTGRKWEINQISLLEVMIDTIFVVVTASGIIISKFYDYDETIGCILGDNPTTNESLPIPADEILELYEVVILTQY